MPQRQPFQKTYPHIHHWVIECGGSIEIGPDYNLESFVRVYDEGGMVYEGNASYPSLDTALADLDAGIKAWIDENGL